MPRAAGSNLEQPPLALDGPEEVRQAAQAFNAMQQRLIAMVNDKAYFLAAVSHDLRTPLTRMRLRLERLPDDEHRQRLRQNITQMDDMIGQVLDYLRAGEQQNLQQVDLDRLVARQCADLAGADEPLPVHGQAGSLQVDALLLQRCLQNLLVNALRYAKDVSVTLERATTGCRSISTTAGRALRRACWRPLSTRSCAVKGRVTRRPGVWVGVEHCPADRYQPWRRVDAVEP